MKDAQDFLKTFSIFKHHLVRARNSRSNSRALLIPCIAEVKRDIACGSTRCQQGVGRQMNIRDMLQQFPITMSQNELWLIQLDLHLICSRHIPSGIQGVWETEFMNSRPWHCLLNGFFAGVDMTTIHMVETSTFCARDVFDQSPYVLPTQSLQIHNDNVCNPGRHNSALYCLRSYLTPHFPFIRHHWQIHHAAFLSSMPHTRTRDQFSPASCTRAPLKSPSTCAPSPLF